MRKCLLLLLLFAIAPFAGGESIPPPNDDSHIPRTFEVGPKMKYATIEAAYKDARPGDMVLVYPLQKDEPYLRTALIVTKPRITFIAVLVADRRHVHIDGSGYEYSGAGSVPRAVFQFNKGADGCVLHGFEIYNARNESSNGAAVRINEANDITVRYCNFHDNDMGVMSNGSVTTKTAMNSRFEYCVVHGNGSEKHAGYNHNFYMGGSSVVLFGCELYEPTTGHNFKSRAHYNRIEYSYIHDSANREFDLVDADNTEAEGSHTLLLGNYIVKSSNCKGNRAVIHFGTDGGKDHKGTLYLAHNTIVTPYLSPVVDLSAPSAGAYLADNLIWDGDDRGEHTLFSVSKDAALSAVVCSNNWLSRSFSLPDGVADADNVFDNSTPPFADIGKHDMRLVMSRASAFHFALAPDKLMLPLEQDSPLSAPDRLMQYVHPLTILIRGDFKKSYVGAGVK